MFSKTKLEQIIIQPGNMIRKTVFYQILMILGDSVLLGGFKLGDEILYLLGLDTNFFRCISNGDLILDDGHEYLVELLRRHVNFHR